MTALLLSGVGASLGGAVGGPFGAMLGRLGGALAGNIIDQRLFGRRGGGNRVQEGPRLKDLDVQASTEGAPIPLVFGRARVTGEIIWATRFEEVATTDVQRAGGGGGKGGLGGGGGGQGGTVTMTTYTYVANLAVGLCEGPIAAVGRVWADGKPLDLNGIVMRVHTGAADQAPDPLIQAKEGRTDVPAYRGLAYVVFERLPLAPYGNRVPQLAFEVIRPVGSLEPKVRGLCVIPGATEFGYHTVAVGRDAGFGKTGWENKVAPLAGTDFVASIDEAMAVAQNLAHVTLVVVWFGDDLRCGVCRIEPAVDLAAKVTTGAVWSVAGRTRNTARVVSSVNGRAAYGGTPSDDSVIAAIQHLKARGLSVTLLPMVFLDVPPGTARPDPWTGDAAQPAHPWRGRITCDPAPGRSGSPDGTPSVTAQIEAFFDAGYGEMIRHYAGLAAAAGGIDTFVVGSELRSLTRLRAGPRSYPAVERLGTLAAEAAAALPGATITYAADWTEYGGYVPPGRPGDLLFPLDGLWAHPAIGRVGIDLYAPLTDWRDGEAHADAARFRSGRERAALAAGVAGGEAFDWYYADDAARAGQARTPITDGAGGQPWIYRPKDLVGWWSNPHVERIDGVAAGPTAWVPAGKPIRFMELGVPAVDKGGNAPNIFPDARSSEGGRPPFSSGARDDAVQRRAIEAVIDHFDPSRPGADARNPVSPLDGRRMVENDRTALWCWDARPWPAFPSRTDIWADGAHWWTGHWLNGRLGTAPLDALLAALARHFGDLAIDATDVEPVLAGYVVDRPMSGRAAIEPLTLAFGLDVIERPKGLVVRPRGGAVAAVIDADTLAVADTTDRPVLVRGQESELPRAVTLIVSDPDRDYRRAAVTARRPSSGAKRESRSDLAVVMAPELLEPEAELILRRLWAARESASFALPPSWMGLEPGDVVTLVESGHERTVRLTKLTDGLVRAVEAEGEVPGLGSAPAGAPRRSAPRGTNAPGRPYAVVLDLPALPGDPEPWRPRLAITADPWPGAVRLWRAVAGGHEPVALVERAATLGTLDTELAPGPVWRFDRGATPVVTLVGGTLTAVSDDALLDGANAFALRHADGSWEVLQAGGATLVGARRYRLTGLLRGQLGTERLAARAVPPGALLVRLDQALVPLPVRLDDVGRETHWRVAPPASTADDEATSRPLTIVPPAAGLVPLAPVHARAWRVGEGVHIAFRRRTRVDGDGWDLAEVPLGETIERYRIEIRQAGTVRRTLVTDTPEALYPAALEAADFGGPQTSLALTIRQESALVGPGHPLDVILPIDR